MSSSSPVMRKLYTLFANHPFLKINFSNAFAQARLRSSDAFVDLDGKQMRSVDDFLRFYEGLLKWVPSENACGTLVLQRLCLFYFVLDTPPLGPGPNSWQQSLIEPSTNPSNFTDLSKWIVEYAQEMGKWMDTEESINDEAIESFRKAKKYHMDDYDIVKWKTFNEFFARHIKPSVRPIDHPEDDTVIVHPADAKFDGSWHIDHETDCSVKIKGIHWGIKQLLGDKASHFGSRFAGGKFCHSFLGPYDYHRIHAPVSGRVVDAQEVIPGLCYLQVAVADKHGKVVFFDEDSATPQSGGELHLAICRGLAPGAPVAAVAGGKPPLQAPNTAGYQFIQARGLILIDNPTLGLVAVLPIGMAQVSSVKLVEKLKEPDLKKKDVQVKKGEELGYFQFGGSDVVMVFEAKANVQFTAHQYDRDSEDVNCDDKPDPSFYPFGKQVAKASPEAHPSHD